MIERFLAAFLLSQGGGPSEVQPQKSDGGTQTTPLTAALKSVPVKISGDKFVIQAKENLATYSGNVVAIRADATLKCDTLIAHYTSTQDVSSVECAGRAEATQGDKWATGERADFDNTKGIIVVTGKPQAKQGASRVEGERFTIDLTRDTIRGEKVKTIAAQADPKGKRVPVEITGDVIDVQGRKNTATWTGRVKVKRGPTNMVCDRLVVHYGEDEQIKRAECVGHAEASDGEKWAAGERADYDVNTGDIVVTGNPRARQGPNSMKATKFIIDLPKDVIRGDNVEMIVDPDTVPKPKDDKKGPKK